MRSEADVNYAANPYGMPPERAPRRRLPMSLLLTVGGVTLFAGGVLLAFSLGGGGGVGGPPPMIEPDPAPMKSRPADAGAEDAVPPDRLVYERLSGATRPAVERLLPPPEQPMPRPLVAADPPTGAGAPAPVGEPSKPSAAVNPPANNLPANHSPANNSPANNPPPVNMVAAPTISNPPKPGQVPPPPPGQNGAAPPKPGQVPPPPPGQNGAAPPKPGQPVQLGAPPAALKPPPQPVAAASPPPPPQPAAAASSGGGGGWRVQLASVQSEAEAAAEWKRLQARFPGALSGLSMQVVRVDLGEKGIRYRVHGVSGDETRAKSTCDQLKSQNVGCVIVKP